MSSDRIGRHRWVALENSLPDATWLEKIRLKRRAMTIRSAVWAAAAIAVWLGVSALGLWAWVIVFHRLPPGGLFLVWYVGLGSLIVLGGSAYAPLSPMRGKDPEVTAADEFFHRDP